MKSTLIILALTLSATTSFAQTVVSGLSLASLKVAGRTGSLNANFSILGQVSITKSRLKNADAFRMKAQNLIWTDTFTLAANFTEASLNSSTWKSSKFNKADFSRAELRDSQFINVQIDACSFAEADLRGTKFSNSSISGCSFARAKFNDSTVLPFDFETAEKLGMIYVN